MCLFIDIYGVLHENGEIDNFIFFIFKRNSLFSPVQYNVSIVLLCIAFKLGMILLCLILEFL